MEIPFQENCFWKRSSGVFLRYQGQSRILRQPVTPGFLQAIKPILHSWLGDHNFTMVRAAFFLAFFAFLRCNEFIYQGISRFRPRLTCPLTVCRYSPVWLPGSECLFFLRLPSPMPFAKGIRLLLHSPPHRFVRWLLCVITFRPLARADHFFLSNSGVNLLDPPSLTFSGTPRVKPVYHITLSKGTVFVLALLLRQLLLACKTG